MIFNKPQNFDGNILADELAAAGIVVTGLVKNSDGIIIQDDRFFIESDKLRFGFEIPAELQELAVQIVSLHNSGGE